MVQNRNTQTQHTDPGWGFAPNKLKKIYILQRFLPAFHRRTGGPSETKPPSHRQHCQKQDGWEGEGKESSRGWNSFKKKMVLLKETKTEKEEEVGGACTAVAQRPGRGELPLLVFVQEAQQGHPVGGRGSGEGYFRAAVCSPSSGSSPSPGPGSPAQDAHYQMSLRPLPTRALKGKRTK